MNDEREVIATALEAAAIDWTAHQRANMGRGTVQQISVWLRERAASIREAK